jgi:hypothetical protein
VITKEELLDEVWGDRFVGASPCRMPLPRRGRRGAEQESRDASWGRTRDGPGSGEGSLTSHRVSTTATGGEGNTTRVQTGVEWNREQALGRSQLRIARTSLIGREQDVAEVSARRGQPAGHTDRHGANQLADEMLGKLQRRVESMEALSTMLRCSLPAEACTCGDDPGAARRARGAAVASRDLAGPSGERRERRSLLTRASTDRRSTLAFSVGR